MWDFSQIAIYEQIAISISTILLTIEVCCFGYIDNYVVSLIITRFIEILEEFNPNINAYNIWAHMWTIYILLDSSGYFGRKRTHFLTNKMLEYL